MNIQYDLNQIELELLKNVDSLNKALASGEKHTMQTATAAILYFNLFLTRRIVFSLTTGKKCLQYSLTTKGRKALGE